MYALLAAGGDGPFEAIVLTFFFLWLPATTLGGLIVHLVRPRVVGLTIPLAVLGVATCAVFFNEAFRHRLFHWDLSAGDYALLVPIPFAAMILIATRTRPKYVFIGKCECGYDLTANESGTCPECGEPIASAACCE